MTSIWRSDSRQGVVNRDMTTAKTSQTMNREFDRVGVPLTMTDMMPTTISVTTSQTAHTTGTKTKGGIRNRGVGT